MLNQFNNLPGIYVNKDDGNLRILESIPGGVTVVLGTSPDGPLGQLYFVTDTGTAERTFDPTGSKQGTLIRGLYEAQESGAKYVALLRVGGSPVALDFINGHAIISNDGSSTAGSKYKLYYTNNHSGSEVIRIYDATTGTILYDSYAKIDNGQFTVIGTQVFNSSTPITIGADVNSWSTSPTFAALADFTQAANQYGSADNATLVNAAKKATTTSVNFKAGQIVKVTGTDTSNNGYYLVNYVTNTNGTYEVNFSDKLTFSNGVVTIAAWTGFVGTVSTAATFQLVAKYIAPDTGVDLSLNQLFQAYARAYWLLESAKVDKVIPTGIYFDTANLVDNEGRFRADQAGFVAPSGAFLGKGYEFEQNGQLFFAFKNSFTNSADLTASELPTPYELGVDGFAAKAWLTGTKSFPTSLTCTSDADITAAANDISYSELNFGYQLAAYLDDLSTNDNEASGSVSMTVPTNFSKPAITQWLGKTPTIAAATGDIVVSGTGVLGYKFMAGSLGQKKGLFRTSTGYVDGAAILDRNQMPIDIGKYIDVIATPLVIVSAYDNTSTGTVTGAAGVYGGLTANLEPSQSPLNKKVKSHVRLAFPLAKKYLDALTATGYVTFTTATDGSVKVVDAPTAALSTSDYNRRAVCSAAWSTLDVIRAIAEPYIGAMTSSAVLQNLEDQLNSALKDLSSPQKGWLLGGQAVLRQTKAMAIKGEAALQLTLVTANELRRLTIYLALTK